MKYRKKPVTIDAFQLNPNESVKEDWFLDAISNSTIIVHSTYCDIKTLEGTMRANLGDYIIRGINGEIYPCKPDIFAKTYELVESEDQEMMDIKVGDVVRFATDTEKMIVVSVTSACICTINDRGQVDTWKKTASLHRWGNMNVADKVENLLNTIRK